MLFVVLDCFILNMLKIHKLQVPIIHILSCPNCHKGNLKIYINDAVTCSSCKSWFPIVNGVLELLPTPLSYFQDRFKWFRAHHGSKLKLSLDNKAYTHFNAQKQQQKHFDWYQKNSKQSYRSYEQSPFWKEVDMLTWEEWLPYLSSGSLVLDVGCAQGRSSEPFISHGATVVGFDISKEMIKEAQKRFASYQHKEKAPYFFVGDATQFPFQDGVFDIVILHGVLHHLKRPEYVCREIARVLKPNGIYLGHENNKTPLRLFFDMLQRYFPAWYEQAGEEPMMNDRMFRQWFRYTNMNISTKSRVFIPPHLINLLPQSIGLFLLRWTDFLFQHIPPFSSWGGIILVKGEKSGKQNK